MTIDSYYQDKLGLLGDVFGAADVRVVDGGLMVDESFLPVVDDVIVALDPVRLPPGVARKVTVRGSGGATSTPFDADVQYTFGEEWKAHPRMLPEYHSEFEQYFDLVDLSALTECCIADLGCGMGRWSYFMSDLCRDIVLVDFSESIFVARDLLRHADNAVFVMADILDLPFRDDAFDLVYCLGVLHHLPVNALDGVRAIRRLAPRQLAYLYYALDNRPPYFRWVLSGVTSVRRLLARARSPRARSALSWLITLAMYAPLAVLGALTRPLGLGRFIPLVDAYAENRSRASARRFTTASSPQSSSASVGKRSLLCPMSSPR
ncbi:MAG: class I SAM-dependent methyltransferase [Actinomycetota bacterium]|nr:class I SAM-dependent methyltransferase [Actinomycetota bacterium]